MIISIDHQLDEAPEDRQPRGLFIMDFDGTLLRSDRTFSSIDLDALGQLGELGIIRTIATGRSLYSFNTAALRDLPVDFVIFSMGAGIVKYPGGKVVRRVSLESHEVKRACEILKTNRLDFMVHRTIPDNHMFSYFRSNEGNDDFERRLKLYSRFAVPLNEATDGFGPATQLLAVVPDRDSQAVLEKVRSELPDYSVIRTTSPLDGKATWIEIFSTVVSKSRTAAWLAEELISINAEPCRWEMTTTIWICSSGPPTAMWSTTLRPISKTALPASPPTTMAVLLKRRDAQWRALSVTADSS
jgi:hydroxymethylpyrimidine pyrophosphatase-like HAD family hydrolase